MNQAYEETTIPEWQRVIHAEACQRVKITSWKPDTRVTPSHGGDGHGDLSEEPPEPKGVNGGAKGKPGSQYGGYADKKAQSAAGKKAAADKKAPKKPSFAPPLPPQKIVKSKKKSSPPTKPEPTYANLKKSSISLPIPPQETAKKTYASSMADLNTCGLPDTEMLRRTSSMRNPPFRPIQPDLPEHVLGNTGARTRANLNQLLNQDLQELREAAAAGGLNEAWEDTQV